MSGVLPMVDRKKVIMFGGFLGALFASLGSLVYVTFYGWHLSESIAFIVMNAAASGFGVIVLFTLTGRAKP